MLDNLFFGAVGTALICSVAGAIYLGILAGLRTPELTSAITLVRGRFGRR
jgi:putative peptidoglycan lipid II flippase